MNYSNKANKLDLSKTDFTKGKQCTKALWLNYYEPDLKPDLDDKTKNRVIGRAICDYVSSYEFGEDTQYEFYIQKENVSGNFPANPFTKLTRTLKDFGSKDDGFDVTTVTVETTLGFPESGMIFIQNLQN